jgi:tight adherence protein B
MWIEAGTLLLGFSLLFWFRAGFSVHRERLERLERKRLSELSRMLWRDFVFVEVPRLKVLGRYAFWVSAALSLATVSPWPVFICFTSFWVVPGIIRRRITSVRRKRFELQFGSALPEMVSVLRAGHTFERALESLASSAPDPLAQELGLVLKERRLGATLDAALQSLHERFPGADLKLAIRSVVLSQRAGTGLSEAFASVSELIRTRRALKDRLSSATAQGRAQAWIAVLMPILLVSSLHFVDPAYLDPLFSTGTGRATLIVSGILLSLGGFWIHRIAHAELLR